MRKIEELGISTLPWFAVDDGRLVCHRIDEEDDAIADVAECCGFGDEAIANGRLIAAAPTLYHSLREAVIDSCDLCDFRDRAEPGGCKKEDGECAVQKWRNVLELAGGARV